MGLRCLVRSTSDAPRRGPSEASAVRLVGPTHPIEPCVGRCCSPGRGRHGHPPHLAAQEGSGSRGIGRGARNPCRAPPWLAANERPLDWDSRKAHRPVIGLLLPSVTQRISDQELPHLDLGNVQMLARGELLPLKEGMVGARGFEPPTSATPLQRASQAAPRPDRRGHVLSGQRHDVNPPCPNKST